MAPSWVAWANVAANTSTTSITPPIPTSSVGDLLILSAGCINSNTAFVVTKSGADEWNVIAEFDVGASRIGFWWKRREASETAPTVTNAGRTSTNLLTAALDSYTGILGSGDPITNISQAAVTGGAIVGPALITTRNNSLAVTRFMRLGANTATTPTAPWNEDRDNGTSGGGAARFYGDSQIVLTPSSIDASDRGGSGATFGAVAFEVVSEALSVTQIVSVGASIIVGSRRGMRKGVAATVSVLVTSIRGTAKGVHAAASSVIAILKAATRTIVIAVPSAASVAALRGAIAFEQAINVAVISGVTLRKGAFKLLSLAVSTAPSTVRRIDKVVSATSIAAVQSTKIVASAVRVVSSSSSAVSKGVTKKLSVTVGWVISVIASLPFVRSPIDHRRIRAAVTQGRKEKASTVARLVEAKGKRNA